MGLSRNISKAVSTPGIPNAAAYTTISGRETIPVTWECISPNVPTNSETKSLITVIHSLSIHYATFSTRR